MLLALMITGPAVASSSLEWKGSMGGRSVDDSLSQSRTVSLGGSLRGLYSPSPFVRFNAEASAVMETGSSSSLFTEEFRPRTGMSLSEGTVTLLPWNFLHLKAGAVNQRHLESELLVTSGTFPAAMEILKAEGNTWLAGVELQQAIPTGTRLSQKQTGKEDTPRLFTERLVLEWEQPESWLLRGRATHFQFQNLTRGIAQDSRFYGNTVNGIAASSQFVYPYRGFEFGLETEIALGNIDFRFGGSTLQNTGAPKGQNRGRHAFVEPAVSWTDIEIAPRLEHYRNEADSAPAYYTNAAFGHNNRKGLGAGLRVSFLKAKIDVTARFHKTRLIEPRTFQRDNFKYAEILLETPYAPF